MSSNLIDSASLVLLRQGRQGIEVFMLKRHSLSPILAGAYVFAGGKLDATDLSAASLALLDASEVQLHHQLGENHLPPSGAAGLYVAAIREAFEECGVLLAHATSEQLAQIRQAINSGKPWAQAIAGAGVRLNTQALTPLARWITPKLAHRMQHRFDTRFFLAIAPADQTAVHDNHETSDSAWLKPQAALQMQFQGEIELLPPQIMTLTHLSRFSHVDDAIRLAQNRQPPTIETETFEENGCIMICYPGDPRHSQSTAAFLGPTRIKMVGQTFAPIQGLHEWLGNTGQ